MKRQQKLPTGIDRRPDGKFRVRVSWEGRQVAVGNFFTLGDAKAALAIARGQMARGLFVSADELRRRRKQAQAEEAARRVTVRDWSTTWLDSLERLGRSPGTITSYRSTLNAHVLDLMGDKALHEVTQDHITGLVADMTPSVARNVIRTISAMYGAAIKAGVGGVTRAPTTLLSIEKPRRAHGDESYHATPEEVGRLAAGMPAQLRAAVWLAAACDLRQGEILGLQRCDLDLAEGDAWVHIRRQWLSKASPPQYAPPKSGSSGTVAVPASVAQLLRDHLNRFVGPDDAAPVFASGATPVGPPKPNLPARPLSQGAFSRHWNNAREGVRPGLHFHALRHSGLTWYAQTGATPAETQARGRHSSLEVAMRYQESTRARDRALTDKLDTAIATATKREQP